MEFEDLPRMQSLTPEPEIMKYDFNDKSSHISMDPEMNFNLGCKHISQVSTICCFLFPFTNSDEVIVFIRIRNNDKICENVAVWIVEGKYLIAKN